MPAKLTAVLGACKRRGRWKVSAQTNAFVLLGHCHIDYREAYADLDMEKMKLKVTCLLGNATFIVPEGSDIQPSAVSLLASTAFDVPEVDVEAPLPTLVIETTTVLGRCRVLTTPPAEADENASVDGGVVDELGRVDTRVDKIGPVGNELPGAQLPPLEAVAKALLAEPGVRTEADERKTRSAVEPLGIGLMPLREGKDSAAEPLGLGSMPPRHGEADLGGHDSDENDSDENDSDNNDSIEEAA